MMNLPDQALGCNHLKSCLYCTQPEHDKTILSHSACWQSPLTQPGPSALVEVDSGSKDYRALDHQLSISILLIGMQVEASALYEQCFVFYTSL